MIDTLELAVLLGALESAMALATSTLLAAVPTTAPVTLSVMAAEPPAAMDVSGHVTTGPAIVQVAPVALT